MWMLKQDSSLIRESYLCAEFQTSGPTRKRMGNHEEDQREDAMLIHEIGATAVRLAHYQHAQSFL